jgi:Derlin-2/3
MEFLNAIPPFTKVWGVAILGMGGIVTLGIVHHARVLWWADAVFYHGELWRLITGPFFIGPLDLQLIFSAVFPLMMISRLESSLYSHRLSTMTFLFIMNAIFVLALCTALGSFAAGRAMLSAFEYLYSKLLSSVIVNVFMILPIPAAYLPFVQIAMDLMSKQSPVPNIIGIIAGHTVFYLLYLLPVLIKRPVFRTPPILVQWLDGEGAANAQPGREPGGGRGLPGAEEDPSLNID